MRVTGTRKPTDWKAKAMEMAPLATCLLILSGTYTLIGVSQRDRKAGTVGVWLAIALVLLPVIWFVVGRLQASGWKVLKSWGLLFPVVGWIAGTFLWRWIKAAIW